MGLRNASNYREAIRMEGNGSRLIAAKAKARGRLLAATSRAIAELQPAVEAINPATMREVWEPAFETLIVLQRLEHRLSTGAES
jgi:hypothetical protein